MLWIEYCVGWFIVVGAFGAVHEYNGLLEAARKCTQVIEVYVDTTGSANVVYIDDCIVLGGKHILIVT